MSSGPLFTALGASAAVVIAAPFIGQIRGAVQAAFPGQYRLIIAAIVLSALVAALGAAAARIRERRRLRYGALAAAALVGLVYAGVTATGNADRDLVERFHFVEYGLLTYLFYRVWRPRRDLATLILPVCAGMIVGVADEWFQWLVPTRVGELSDVLLNTAAVVCGLLFSVGVNPPLPFSTSRDRRTRAVLAAGAAAVVLSAALFVDAVHLGYEIRDPRAGMFRSQFAPEALEAAAADRAARWPAQPPRIVQGIAREDRFFSEGQWHVQRRNEARSGDDLRTAWQENLILETFYAPVLDAGARWSPDERAAIADPVAGDDRAYVSDAEPYPIFSVSRWQFWMAIAAIIAALPVLALGRAPADRSAAGV